VHRLLHRPGGYSAQHGAAGFGPFDQPGIAQHIEMLHDGGQRDRKRPRQVADRHTFFVAEPSQQGAPRRIGQGGKGSIQRGGAGESGFLRLNHMVKY
jgi:hypothetical protein